MKHVLYILFAFSLMCQSLSAYNFRRVDVCDGLSDNHVRDIKRDSAGYIWVATQSGVDRYDGYRVKNIPARGVLSSNPVKIEIDGDNNVWMMTADSLFMLEDGFISNVRDCRRLPSELCRGAYGVADDGGRGLWIFRRDSVFYLDMKSHGVAGRMAAPIRVRDASVFSGGIVMLSAGGDIYVCDRTCRRMRLVSDAVRLHSRLKVAAGVCWLFDGYNPGVLGIPLTDNDDGSLRYSYFNTELVKDVASDGARNVWFATNSDGVHVYSPTGRPIRIIRHTDSAYGISSNHASALFIDDGLLAVGSSKRGLSLASLSGPEFVTVSTGVESDISFMNQREDGSLVIGYDGAGLGIYRAIGEETPVWYYTTANSLLPSNLVIGLSRGDVDGRVYGTYGGGLFTLDANDNIVGVSVPDSARYCRHIIADGSGVWAGTFQNGLFRLGRRSYNTANSALQSNCITGLVRSGDRIFVGTSHGLSVVDVKNGRLERCNLLSGKSAGITTLCADSRRLLWIGTQAGIVVADAGLRPVARITVHDGLISDMIRGIAEDVSGRMWVTSAAGISCVDVSRRPDGEYDMLDVRSFSAKDGLGDIGFNRYSIAATGNGLILAGGFGKYIVVDPAGIPGESPGGRVYVTDVLVNGVSVSPGEKVRGGGVPLTDDVMNCRKVEVDYYNNLQFTLSTLTFADAGNVRYEYSMDGGEWILMPSELLAPGEISSGTHRLAVRVAGRPEVTELQIVVNPPFYKSNVAYAVYALLLLLAVFVLYRLIRRGHMRELGTQRVENALARSENMPVSQDDRFITDAKNAIECNLAREDFGVEELSAALTMSRSNLYKKMMAVAGQTPLEFIRRIRMREGRKLLDGGETSVSQIAYAIGMSPKQFSKYFKDETGMTPTQYIKQRHG